MNPSNSLTPVNREEQLKIVKDVSTSPTGLRTFTYPKGYELRQVRTKLGSKIIQLFKEQS